MDNLNYISCICVSIPLIMSCLVIEKKSRLFIGYLLIGIGMCLYISQVNNLILKYFDYDYYYVTTTFTPITEELIKGLPVLIYAFFVSDRRQTLLSIAFATGVGFAIQENLVILMANYENVSVAWALSRGFGSSLMHSVCTMAVGIGISFVYKKKKLFVSGTFALLMLAMIYHGIFNTLVQSNVKYVGIVLPVITYIPILISVNKWAKKKKESK